jgi:hypothetical protein
MTQKGILHFVLKDKYLSHTTTASWLNSATPPPRTASNLWKNLNKSVRWIHDSLSWFSGLGSLIILGKDRITGMGQHSLLSPQLLNFLNTNHRYFLFHASENTQIGFPSNHWLSSQELALPTALAGME